MGKVIEDLEPDVVVATNSPRSERAALDVARSMVSTLHRYGGSVRFGQRTYVTHACKPDWTCVISEGVRQRLIGRGFPASGVVVTGNPAFDGLFDPGNQVLAQQFLVERGWQGLRTILFAGHWEPVAHPSSSVPVGQSLPREIEDVLRQHVRQRDDLALIVRYHPSDWTEYPRLPDEARIHFRDYPSK